MRILHVTESMGAGTATAIGQYVGCDDFDHRLLARVRDDSFAPEPWLDTLPHVLVPDVRALVREWLRARREPIDVVHAHSTVAGHLTRVLPHPQARTVYSPHGLAAVHHRRRVVRSTLTVSERWLARRADAVAAVGASEEAELATLVGRTPVVRLPHALPVHSDRRPSASAQASVCAVGRLSYQKAPDTVADLPRQLAAQGFDAEWTWIGDGDDDTRRAMQAGGWHVTGWVDSAEVAKRVSEATALLHPARYEGLSLAIVEALSHGTPVVARRITSNSEFDGALLFDTTEEAGELVRRLVVDADQWAAVSRAGLGYVAREHAQSAQALALHRLYGDVGA